MESSIVRTEVGGFCGCSWRPAQKKNNRSACSAFIMAWLCALAIPGVAYQDRPVLIPDLPMGAAPPGNHSLLGTELFPASSLLPDVRMPVLVPYISPGAATAVIVIPGGGFVELGTLEGEPVARAFQQRNITALLLRYRVNGTAWPMGELPDYRNWPCLIDAQRAMAVARGRASDWGYDPERIGIVGIRGRRADCSAYE